MLIKFNKAKIISICNVIFCGINNINAGCQNCGKKATIDLDNFEKNDDIIPSGLSFNFYVEEYKLYDLDKNTVEKLKAKSKEINDLRVKNSKEDDPQKNNKIQDEIDKKTKELNEILVNKFYFYLARLDGFDGYKISYKKNNINIVGYEKVTEKHKDYIESCKKYEDYPYEGGPNINQDDIDKIDEFKKNNGEFYILYKVTKLQKKKKNDTKNEIVDYSEIVDIFKKK